MHVFDKCDKNVIFNLSKKSTLHLIFKYSNYILLFFFLTADLTTYIHMRTLRILRFDIYVCVE